MVLETDGRFVKGLASDPEFIFEAAAKFFRCKRDELLFAKEDLTVELGKLGEVNTIKLIYSMPEAPLLCYRAYIFYDDACDKIGYFGLAKGDERAQGRPILGTWRDGKFCVYSFARNDDAEVFKRCFGIYMSPEFTQANEERKAKRKERKGFFGRMLSVFKHK